MFWPIYLFLGTAALLSTYQATIRVEGVYVCGAFATFLSILLGIASVNIEAHTSTGEAVSYGSEYLFIVWAGVALINIVFLVPAPFEALAEAVAGNEAGRSRNQS
ncbi:hypothetical protein [Halomarina oriensis]|uniref:Uncharacterized protein n=1 Tax=Halomarina oriensis TaxID=671145 RepID=A0A6B0GGQ5_9EURY|nr:hypothetical protein [Halomarina oriensis]MWG33147.1 hypothetical protein [Halomarina oriensis]